jgi:hypothetical protein
MRQHSFPLARRDADKRKVVNNLPLGLVLCIIPPTALCLVPSAFCWQWYVSDDPRAGTIEGYGVMILSRVPVQRFQVYAFPSGMYVAATYAHTCTNLIAEVFFFSESESEARAYLCCACTHARCAALKSRLTTIFCSIFDCFPRKRTGRAGCWQRTLW